jgi:hypothetical protein
MKDLLKLTLSLVEAAKVFNKHFKRNNRLASAGIMSKVSSAY